MPSIGNIGNHFELFIPKDLNITDQGRLKAIGESIQKFYFGDKAVSAATTMELTNLISDVFFEFSSVATAKIMNSRLTSPIYQYLFDFEATLGVMKSLFDIEKGNYYHLYY